MFNRIILIFKIGLFNQYCGTIPYQYAYQIKPFLITGTLVPAQRTTFFWYLGIRKIINGAGP
jgi:hypothetical protein